MNTWQKIGQFFLTYRNVFAAMRRGRIWLPFFLYALVELAVLAWVHFGVRPPFVDFFRGPLGFIVPDAFFGYPAHLLLLPRVFYTILIPFGALVESFLMAAATLLFVRYFQNHPLPGLSSALAEVRFGYPQFVVFWIINFLLLYGYQSLYGATLGGLWVGYARRQMALQALNFALSVLANSIVAYATVVILVERTGLGGSLKRSLAAFGRYFVATLVIVGFSSLVAYPFNFILQHAQDWIGRFDPQVMLLALAGNVVVTAVAAFIATGALTLWYLLQRQPD